MPRIFVSHSASDSDLAGRLAEDLRSAGYEPWVDNQSVRAGSPIVSSIDDAAEACHYFIVILSPQAVASPWVQAEVMSILWSKLSERRHKQIIPALRSPCDVPPQLKHLRHANFANGYTVGFAQVYAAIDMTPLADKWPSDLLPPDQLVSLERDAGGHASDHIRFACAHTLWSVRPDRAKHILENQLGDWKPYVARHAQLILDRHY